MNPCLLSSNKSRPHLSTYIVISEEQEGAVQLQQWILSRVSRYEVDQLKNTIGGAGTNDDVIPVRNVDDVISLKYSEMHVFSEKMVEELVACEWQAKTVVLRV